MGCWNRGREALFFEVQAPGFQRALGAGLLALVLQLQAAPLVLPRLGTLPVGFGAVAFGLAVGFLLGELALALGLLVLLLAGGLGLRGFLQLDFGEPVRQAPPVGLPLPRPERGSPAR